LHQDYRAAAMPATAELVRTLRAAGHPAVVSGAGPTVLVLDIGPRAALEAPAGWRLLPLDVARDGAGAVG
jgi:homoserine kinase